jgi:SAM-dependent methyltransferase
VWNDRFASPDYVFGTEPAVFLTDHADWLREGASALSVADGEGRNSVFMARQGCAVTAFDMSANALVKARALAEASGVEVDFHEADILGWDWSAQYDIVAGIFIQFTPPAERAEVFAGMVRALAPGGTLLLHGYTPKQIEYGTGGPPVVENLYTPELLAEAFGALDIRELNAYERVIEEGKGHSGHSALIDLVAVKPG